MEIRISFPGGLRVDAEANGFIVRTDQPVAEGGEGSAPEPFLLFLASLGTCAGSYILSFCQARRIPTDGIQVLQTIQRNPDTNMVDKIGIEIQIPPSFPEKYRNALVKAANLCTVKKHLVKPPVVETVARVV
ncbi:MAG: OsmC family protein [Bradymonadales bacterium]|nr:OsmC family protein [Bradymonadales bacterium]